MGDDLTAASCPPLPRSPILDWSSFRIVDAPGIASVNDLPHRVFTTSGRAAIYQALLQLRLPAQSGVLVPTYHCPTMVAPVILAGLTPLFFPLTTNGLPDLESIPASTSRRCKAMLVSHYFGFARSLSAVRAWCDERGIAMIEDCAHCYFGEAGERPIGGWGDFATASLSKFLPVAEGGLLGSMQREIAGLALAPPGMRMQVKGWVDVLELATQHRRLAGLNKPLGVLMKLKGGTAPAPKPPHPMPVAGIQAMMQDCDMGRVAQRPTVASRILDTILPRGRIIRRRQENFATYARHFAHCPGARPLFPLAEGDDHRVAPYVFPLWVDDPEPVYQATRERRLPVFRWDRIWPGTPTIAGDAGALWNHHVLQLLCHQDLDVIDVETTSRTIVDLLRGLPQHPHRHCGCPRVVENQTP